MAKPSSLPRWASVLSGGNRVDPPSGKKDTGWASAEEPAHSYMNWLQYTCYEWAVYLDGLTSEALTWTNTHIFQNSVTMQDNLQVLGETTLDALNVDAGAVFAGAVQVNTTIAVDGTATLNGTANLNGDLNVGGMTTLDAAEAASLTVSGDTTVGVIKPVAIAAPATADAGDIHRRTVSNDLYARNWADGAWAPITPVRCAGYVAVSGGVSTIYGNGYNIDGALVNPSGLVGVRITFDATLPGSALDLVAFTTPIGTVTTMTIKVKTFSTTSIDFEFYDQANASIDPSAVPVSFFFKVEQFAA